jgi:hypothetical protein
VQNSSRSAARTGITETTVEIGRYPDPDQDPTRPPLVWYDIPGAGTLTIPGWQYFNGQALFAFDIVLVVVDNRFTTIDVEILKNCKRFAIPSFIIRSKADQHIANLMTDLPCDGDDDDGGSQDTYARALEIFVAETRKSVLDNLDKAGLPPQQVYIVSKRAVYNLMVRTGGGSAVSTGMIDEERLLRDMLTTVYHKRYGGRS